VSVADRLKELGIELPAPTGALAVYRPAVRTGNLIFVSGQIAMKDGGIMTPGHLGAGVTVEQGYAAARQCALNALAAVIGLQGSLEGLRLIRTVGYVAATPEFTEQGAVVNGASELLRDIFGTDDGLGARISIGLASLPLGTPVEVELLFEVA
jgi:enamine deaminase RidA (YjgF/YER057c/UK114 family)